MLVSGALLWTHVVRACHSTLHRLTQPMYGRQNPVVYGALKILLTKKKKIVDKLYCSTGIGTCKRHSSGGLLDMSLLNILAAIYISLLVEELLHSRTSNAVAALAAVSILEHILLLRET